MIITLESLLWTLPIIFMIHEFEEIIMFNPWYRKNELWLVGKHPKLEKMYKIAKSSTSALSLGISYEFVLISVITLIAVELKIYALWIGILIGFFLHLCGHIGSSFIKRGYVPSLFTSILGVIYTLVVIEELIKMIKLDLIDVFMWTVVAIILIVVNLQIVIKIIETFDKWLINWSKA